MTFSITRPGDVSASSNLRDTKNFPQIDDCRSTRPTASLPRYGAGYCAGSTGLASESPINQMTSGNPTRSSVPPTCSAPYKKSVEKFKLVMDYLRVKQTAPALEDQKRLAEVNKKEDSKCSDNPTSRWDCLENSF